MVEALQALVQTQEPGDVDMDLEEENLSDTKEQDEAGKWLWFGGWQYYSNPVEAYMRHRDVWVCECDECYEVRDKIQQM
jgi:hypothetical protein